MHVLHAANASMVRPLMLHLCQQNVHTGAPFMLHHRKCYMNLRKPNVVSAHTSDLRSHWNSAFAIGISLFCDKNTNVGGAEWVYQFRKCHSQRERKLINEHPDSNGLKWIHREASEGRRDGEWECQPAQIRMIPVNSSARLTRTEFISIRSFSIKAAVFFHARCRQHQQQQEQYRTQCLFLSS